MMPYALAAAVGTLIGAVAGFFVARGAERSRQEKERAAAKDEASRILTQASREAESLQKSAALSGREEALRLRETWEQEETRRREELERVERRLELFTLRYQAVQSREFLIVYLQRLGIAQGFRFRG